MIFYISFLVLLDFPNNFPLDCDEFFEEDYDII